MNISKYQHQDNYRYQQQRQPKRQSMSITLGVFNRIVLPLLCCSLLLINQLAMASVYKSVVTLGPVDRPLSPNAVQSICEGIYHNLSSTAVNKLDISADGKPFDCASTTDSNGNKLIKITSYVTIDN